jgi:hypothetical protein
MMFMIGWTAKTATSTAIWWRLPMRRSLLKSASLQNLLRGAVQSETPREKSRRDAPFTAVNSIWS